MRKKHKRIFVILCFVLLLSLLINAYLVYRYVEIPEPVEEISLEDVDLLGLVKVSYNVSDDGLIRLVHDCEELTAQTSEVQAISINEGIQKTHLNRPWSHDLISDILNYYEINVLFVRITEINYGWYYSDLVLEKDGFVLSVDCKPSDAMAVAVRFNAPIYVSSELFEKYGVNICDD